MTNDLTKYSFKTLYSSSEEVEEFYKIALNEAKLYRRISAYFSNDVFKFLKKGLTEFIKNEGYFQLILSKEINSDTIDEIEKGYILKEEKKYLLYSKDDLLKELSIICDTNDISIFSFLIAIGKLDVKIAYKKVGNVHDKFGLISDGKHTLAYIGSNNFTSNAIQNNDEAFQVTIDWEEPSKREIEFISQLDSLFTAYWNNEKQDVITINLPNPLITQMIDKIDYGYIKKYIEITDFIRLDINDEGLITIFTNVDENELFTYKNFRTYKQFITNDDKLFVLKNINIIHEIDRFCTHVKNLCKNQNINYYITYKLNKFLELNVRNYNAFKLIGEKIKRKEYKNSIEFSTLKDNINKILKRPLVEQQIIAASHIINMEKSLNFSVPGSGKTATVIGAFEYLNTLPKCNKCHVDKLLIIGPINCCKSWNDEYSVVSFEANKHRPLNIIDSGDRYDKAQILKNDYATSRLIIINYDSIIALKNEVISLVDEKTMIVFDEIHRIKNITSEKYKALYKITKKTRFRVALTGTPLPNGYIDLYNIISLLHDDYTSSYFRMNHKKLIAQDRIFKKTGCQSYDLNQLINPFYIRVNKNDLEVPPANPDHLIQVKVNSNEKSLYVKISEMECSSFEKMIYYQEVGIVPFKCFNEINENTLMNNLENEDLTFFYTSKIVKFLEQLKNSNRKCVVWCLFVDSINLITKILQNEGYKARAIYGNISQNDRDKIIDKFNFTNEIEIIVTNPATLAESVSLHKSCHDAHYLEYNYNLYQYLQSRDRIHRLGLKESDETNYYLYINQYTDNIEDSADYKILKELKVKEKRMLAAIEKGDFLFGNGDIDFDNI